MLVKKKGFPEEEEIVLCKITKVLPHGAFASLEEYENLSGLIHISEIAPGRIRNLREYVEEGKVVVCKILRINKEKNYIDLSLRRVNESLRRKKLEEIKQLKIAENIIVNLSKENKIDAKKVYDDLQVLLEEYDSLYYAFLDVIEGELSLKDYLKDKKIAEKLESIIKERIKPPEVTIKGIIKLSSFSPNGLEEVKKVLKDFNKIKGISIVYAGGGKYSFTITDKEYKSAEKSFSKLEEKVQKVSKNQDFEIELIREKKH